MITIRPLQASDSLDTLTALLHKAYASLGAQGWNFTAVDQPVELTRKRIGQGRCFVAVQGDQLVGTVLVRGPYRPESDSWSLNTPWYLRRDTAILSQYAVDPDCQGQGLGAQLMQTAEAYAQGQGFIHLALDTAQPAQHLRRRYEASGYQPVAQVHWDGKTYASILMVKPLPHGPLKASLLTLAHYNAWATERLMKALAAVSDEDYRRDVGLFFKGIHGTLNHLRVGEQLLWWPRFALGESNQIALDREIETDRARLAADLLQGTEAWTPTVAGFSDERLAGTLDYRSSQGVPTSLPFLGALQHVFNHSTHHRGQISAALTARGYACPTLDLIAMLVEQQGA
jgi:uncharacterized damage-inducible protein DinB/GNAT superfamily N-acetyltransferase